jgi:hypothetical protein
VSKKQVGYIKLVVEKYIDKKGIAGTWVFVVVYIDTKQDKV